MGDGVGVGFRCRNNIFREIYKKSVDFRGNKSIISNIRKTNLAVLSVYSGRKR